MTPIQNLAAVETEKDILSLMMNEADVIIPKVRAALVTDDFYRADHRIIFQTMLEMYQSGKAVDLTTLVPELDAKGELDKVGGIMSISDIYGKFLGTGALDTYLDIVKDRSRRRNAISLMDVAIAQAQDLSSELDLMSFQTKLAKVAATRYVKERSMYDIAQDFLQEINERCSEDVSSLCINTGLSNLDSIIHGMRKQELIYLAARPSMGKSALAIQVAINAAVNDGKSVMYVSLEMGERQIFGRAAANIAKVDAEKIMYSAKLATDEKLQDDYAMVIAATERIGKSKLHIRTLDVNTPQGIYNQAQQIQGKYGLDLIIIDHIHLMRSGLKYESDNQNVALMHISSDLKRIAMDFDIPVLALAQLSRGVESRNDKRPLLSDLRDSGSLEQDADKVIMLYRASYYNKQADDNAFNQGDPVEIIVRKQRDGRLGVAWVEFYKQFSLMVPIDKPEMLNIPL